MKKYVKKITNGLMLLRFHFKKLSLGKRLISKCRNYMGRGTVFVGEPGVIQMGRDNGFFSGFDIEVLKGRLTIGDQNFFNKNVKIACMAGIDIGSNCIFADSVHIYDHDHKFDDRAMPIRDQGYLKAPVKIGNDVWLGAKVTVIKGVTIGDGVVVGANSVVTKDLPPYTVCGGVPAKILRHRK